MYKVALQVFWCIREAEHYRRMLKRTTGKFYKLEKMHE